MSATPNETPESHDEPHEGPIRTPQQLIATVIASFVVPVVIIIMLVNYVDFGTKPAAGTQALDEAAVAERLKRVGSIEIRDPSGPAVLRTGEQVYQAACTACHASGAAGAPKTGDNAAWSPRLGTGYAALLNSVLKGKGAMPPLGGGDYTDVELGRAVVYLTGRAGGNFPEPAVPAPAAAASAPN